MVQLQISKRIKFLVLSWIVWGWVGPGSMGLPRTLFALEPAAKEKTALTCGVLESYLGDIQILDPTRSHLLTLGFRTPLPCGSWISVGKGWVQIKHQNGPMIHLGKHTFIRLPDFRGESEFKDDQVVLFQGEMYAQAGNGEEEFNMVTATGRARLKRGKVILIFNETENNTQLIALEESATLENRFEISKKVTVHAGEATEMNFKLLRVIPSLPKAVSLSSLKPRMADLRIPQHDQYEAAQIVIQRGSRKFASELVDTDQDESDDGDVHSSMGHSSENGLKGVHKKILKGISKGVQRKLAGKASFGDSVGSYLRYPPRRADSMLHQYWVRKMVGGDEAGERILFPEKFYGKVQQVQVEVEDPEQKLNRKLIQEEDAEKKRLIQELSKIQAD